MDLFSLAILFSCVSNFTSGFTYASHHFCPRHSHLVFSEQDLSFTTTLMLPRSSASSQLYAWFLAYASRQFFQCRSHLVFSEQNLSFITTLLLPRSSASSLVLCRSHLVLTGKEFLQQRLDNVSLIAFKCNLKSPVHHR